MRERSILMSASHERGNPVEPIFDNFKVNFEQMVCTAIRVVKEFDLYCQGYGSSRIDTDRPLALGNKFGGSAVYHVNIGGYTPTKRPG